MNGNGGKDPGSAEPGIVGSPAQARDHLANERTYLAWLRTGASVMVFGLAVAKFGDAVTVSTVAAGGVLVVAGAAGVVYGTRRYRQVNQQLERGEFITGSHGNAAVVASTVLILAVVVSLALLLIGR